MSAGQSKTENQFRSVVTKSLSGKAKVLMFDQPRLHKEISDYKSILQSILSATSREKPVELWAEQFDEKSLLSQLQTPTKNRNSNADEQKIGLPTYRLLCNAMENRRTGIILIHEAEKLNDEAVHILSRLAAFSKRARLDFKYLFFADISQFDELALMQLLVDQYYPKTSTPSKQRAGRASISAPAMVIPIAVLCVVGAMVFSSFNSSNPIEQLGTTDAESTNSEIMDDSAESAIMIAEQQLQEKLLAIHQARVADLELTRALEEIDEQSDLTAQSIQPASTTPSKPVEKADQRSQRQIKPARAQMSKQMLIAIEQADISKIQQLYSNGEPVNAVNAAGETALASAVIANNQSLNKQLIEIGAAVNALDQNGYSPLYYAAISGNQQMLLDLLNAGAKVNSRSPLEKTPLMAATHNSHQVLVELLLQRGAELNLQDHSGWSALQYATWNNNFDLVALLLNKGANPSLVDNDGYDAHAIAELRGHHKLKELLARKKA